MAMDFGWRVEKKKKKAWRTEISRIFVGLLFAVVFAFSAAGGFLQLALGRQNVDVFQTNLHNLGAMFRLWDREVAEFLRDVQDLMEKYEEGENILIEERAKIEKTRRFVVEQRARLEAAGFENYGELFDFLGDAREYRSEIFVAMGVAVEKNYLVILQNSNEKRPNGWFFGSFAFVKIGEGFLKNLEIVDVYFPNFVAPEAAVRAPGRWTELFGEREIQFVAANKFGFTDRDGPVIDELFEKIFRAEADEAKLAQAFDTGARNLLVGAEIDGVIFVETKLFEELLPGFEQKVWERQFVNAAVDLIRGEERGNKKELFIAEVENVFAARRGEIFRGLVANFPEIRRGDFVQIFLEDFPPAFQGFLQKWNLMTVYDPSKIRAWEGNRSFNKIDAFVRKNLSLRSLDGGSVLEAEGDVLSLSGWAVKNGTLEIEWRLSVPENYEVAIESFAKKWEVELTERERGILGLGPTEDLAGNLRFREPWNLVLLPPGTQVRNFRGDGENFRVAETARGAVAVARDSKIIEEPGRARVAMDIELPENF